MMNPIFDVHLRIVSKNNRNSIEVQTLSDIAIVIEKQVTENIYVTFGHSRGKSIFSQINIGFVLFEYDLELFEHNMNSLFDNLIHINPLLQKIMNRVLPSFQFMININSMNDEHKPYSYISPEQLKFLAGLNASLELDGYFFF